MTAATFAFWTQLLALPDYEVVFCQKDSDLQRYSITLAPTQRLGVCPHCGHVCDTIHQTRTRERIKDLSIGPEAVELSVRVLQFECICGQHFTPPILFLAEGAHRRNDAPSDVSLLGRRCPRHRTFSATRRCFDSHQ